MKQVVVAALGSLLVLFLSGCAGVKVLDVSAILPLYDPPRIQDSFVAEQALIASAAEKELQAYQIREQEIACYRKFFVNSCLADVTAQRRQIEARIRAVDLAARSTIRQEQAIAKNESLASSEAQALDKADDKAASRELNVQKSQEKSDDTALKQEKAQDKALQNEVAGAAERASREAKQEQIAQKQSKALAAKAQEAKNAAQTANKINKSKARIAAAIEKSKNAKTRIAPAIRLPKAPRLSPAQN